MHWSHCLKVPADDDERLDKEKVHLVGILQIVLDFESGMLI